MILKKKNHTLAPHHKLYPGTSFEVSWNRTHEQVRITNASKEKS